MCTSIYVVNDLDMHLFVYSISCTCHLYELWCPMATFIIVSDFKSSTTRNEYRRTQCCFVLLLKSDSDSEPEPESESESESEFESESESWSLGLSVSPMNSGSV